jgi:hypothetical protein
MKVMQIFDGDVNIGYQYWHTTGDSSCITVNTSFQCTWSDKQCHSLWTSDVSFVGQGYVARRCRINGHDQFVCAKDYEFSSPTEITRLGCAALCSDDSYPGPVPTADQNNLKSFISYGT